MIETVIQPQAIVHKPSFNLSKVEFNLANHGVNNKPEKALWTSTYVNPTEQIGWIDWCIREHFYSDDFSVLYKVIPKKDFKAKIYTIDKMEDYTSSDLPKINHRTLEGEFINYKSLRDQGYTGLRITEDGAWLGHSFSLDWDLVMKLNAFDCESTVWFTTDWIDKVEVIDNQYLKSYGFTDE